MPVIRKYEFDFFDRHVAVPAGIEMEPHRFGAIETAVAVAEAPPAPGFDRADLEAAEARGYAEGEAAALGRAELRLADAVERISVALREAEAEQAAVLHDIERQAAALTLACLQKLFPVFLQESGTVEAEALIAQALAKAYGEPHLTLFCRPEDAAGLATHLETAAAVAGFDGKTRLAHDPTMAPGDCRIEWTDGGVARDANQLSAAIEAAIRQSIELPHKAAPTRAATRKTGPEQGPETAAKRPRRVQSAETCEATTL